MRLERNLNALTDRIARAREELRIVEEQILFQMDVVEETKVRMLVSETPLADRDHDEARADHIRMLKERDRVQAQITELHEEQDRLLDRMLGSHT